MASIFAGFENLTPESPFVGIDVTPDSSTLDPPPQPERPPSPPLIQATAAPPPTPCGRSPAHHKEFLQFHEEVEVQ